jgi:AcrR family transcriptional regulator
MRGADRQRMIQMRAAELFASQGYASTTIQDIADAVGIMKGTLYHFYRNKDQILYDLLYEALTVPQQDLDNVISSDLSYPLKIRALIEAMVRYHHDSLPLMVTFTREDINSVADPDLRAELAARQRRFQAAWESVVKDGMASGELRADLDHRLVSFGIIGMVNWMYKWYSPGGRAPAEKIVETFSSMVLDGLKNHPGDAGNGASPRVARRQRRRSTP